MTRTVRDTIAFYAALESRRPPRKVPPIGVRSDQASRPLRIGLFVDSPAGSMVDTEVQQTVREAARLCAGLGHAVEEIPCPFSGPIINDFMRYMAIIAWFGVRLGRLILHFGFDGSKLDPWTTGFVEFFANAKLAGLAATLRLRRFARTFQDVMARFDVLMSPTVPEAAPPLGHLAPDVPFTTLFERMCAFAAFTAPYNVAGAPALSLPMGRGVLRGFHWGSSSRRLTPERTPVFSSISRRRSRQHVLGKRSLRAPHGRSKKGDGIGSPSAE